MSFTYQRNYFVNPANSDTYYWPLNHEAEEQVQNSRQMGSGAPTSDIGLIPQQGEPFPLVLQWTGKLFAPADKLAFDNWYALCETQSIYLYDFASNGYEVIITDWDAKRVTGFNRRSGNGQAFYWEYQINFRVLKVLTGDWSTIPR